MASACWKKFLLSPKAEQLWQMFRTHGGEPQLELASHSHLCLANAHQIVTEPKFTCLTLQSTKLKMLRFEVRSFIDQEGTNQDDGRPIGASNTSCLLDQAKGF